MQQKIEVLRGFFYGRLTLKTAESGKVMEKKAPMHRITRKNMANIVFLATNGRQIFSGTCLCVYGGNNDPAGLFCNACSLIFTSYSLFSATLFRWACKISGLLYHYPQQTGTTYLKGLIHQTVNIGLCLSIEKRVNWAHLWAATLLRVQKVDVRYD